MQPTIIQNGALYALQHGATIKYRRVRQKRVPAELTRARPTFKTPIEKFAMRPIPARKVQSAPQNTFVQLVDAFPDYRVAA
jgi:hypothetical protein